MSSNYIIHGDPLGLLFRESFNEENVPYKYDESDLFEVEDFSFSTTVPSALVPTGQGHETDQLIATEEET